MFGIGYLKRPPAGCTLTATALAMTWPGDTRVLLMEWDPSGGTLAARFGLAAQPNLVTLAGSTRRSASPDLIWEHSQNLGGALPVVPAPAGAEQVAASLATLAISYGETITWLAEESDQVVLADCGRLTADSPALPLLASARLLVIMEPDLAGLACLETQIDGLKKDCRGVDLLLAGHSFPASQVEEGLGLPVLGTIPRDDKAAITLRDEAGRRRLHRRPLLRSAFETTNRLTGRRHDRSDHR
ncbi:hypothetical protein ACIBH1_06785 [Nonomuraea sp. NPDC050663]|uniref:hypothetical protein n=1 Tax=Nonomuraea sp. NPDC050663 TaxID=3364370 RepID=UPI0037A31624